MSHDDHGTSDIDAVVRGELAALVQKAGKPVDGLTDDLRLDADLGLSSLDVTTLLVALTERLDPTRGNAVTEEVDIATVGDLRRAFRPSAAGRPDEERDALAASRRRAEARRTRGR